MLNKDVIKGFVGSLLLKRFDGASAIPKVHEEWWELCCSPNRFVAIAAPRAHAKSTAITFSYTLANVLFRERKFVLIVSDTETQAVLFLGAIKQELQDNRDLIELFGLITNEKGQVVFEKDSESDIIVSFKDGEKFRIIAKGAEQKLRGLLWDGRRPDLIVLDDLENDEIVLNKERRDKFRRWFYGALMPCRAQDGLIRYVGTILHMDAMLERLMPLESDKFTVKEELKSYTTRKGLWKTFKYKAHNPDYSEILWPEKYDAKHFKELKAEYVKQGIPDVYSQEFLNIPIDESSTYFKKADFLPIKEEDKKKKLHYYITVDLAISEKERADWCVFIVGGVDEDGRVQVRNVVRDRMDGMEIVETLIGLQKVYDPLAFGIEEGQISKSIGPFLNEAQIRANTFLNIYPLKPYRQDKITRARSIQARMRAKGVKFDKEADWYQPFEDELMRFPRDKHDDQVDAFAYLGLMIDKLIQAPSKEEEEDLDYYEELETSGYNNQGKSQTTGY